MAFGLSKHTTLKVMRVFLKITIVSQLIYLVD